MIESVEKLNGRRWMPVLPGKNGDWRQHPLIKSIFAACYGCTRSLEDSDWVGNSSGAVNRGGRPAKASQPAEGEGGAAAADSTAAKPRGRPRRPPPVSEDSSEKAAVRARLRNFQVWTRRTAKLSEPVKINLFCSCYHC